MLKRSRWLLLKRPEKLTGEQRGRLAELVRRNLRTVRAYLLKEDFQSLWGYVSPYWAGQFLDRWCTRTMRSRLDPARPGERSSTRFLTCSAGPSPLSLHLRTHSRRPEEGRAPVLPAVAPAQASGEAHRRAAGPAAGASQPARLPTCPFNRATCVGPASSSTAGAPGRCARGSDEGGCPHGCSHRDLFLNWFRARVLQWRCRGLQRKGRDQTGVFRIRGTGTLYHALGDLPEPKTHPQILLTRQIQRPGERLPDLLSGTKPFVADL